jgi:hypothetical protein
MLSPLVAPITPRSKSAWNQRINREHVTIDGNSPAKMHA